MSVEKAIAEHYAAEGLAAAILAAVGKTGVLTPEDLASYDQFHVGGPAATAMLAGKLPFGRGMRVLDVGCGVGGPARQMAALSEATVIGIDLTLDFIETARILGARTAQDDSVSFTQGNALALPFADEAFDGAYMIHAGMNIPDKTRLCAEIARVLKSGAIFGIYDILAVPDGASLTFPLPWATRAAESFLATPQEMTAALDRAGFIVTEQEAWHDFAQDRVAKTRARQQDGTLESLPPPPHMRDFHAKTLHLVDALENGACCPWVFLARKQGKERG